MTIWNARKYIYNRSIVPSNRLEVENDDTNGSIRSARPNPLRLPGNSGADLPAHAGGNANHPTFRNRPTCFPNRHPDRWPHLRRYRSLFRDVPGTHRLLARRHPDLRPG
jgi:hypothetical protein